MAGTARSIDYVAKKTGWQIDRNGSAEFNNAVFRGNVEVGYYDTTTQTYKATGGLLSGKTTAAKDLRFWAGASPDTAAFKVYSDGSLEATKGTFTGTFSGVVQVGNILISDSASPGDAQIVLSDSTNIPLITLNETQSIFKVPTFQVDGKNSAFMTIDTDDHTITFINDGWVFDLANNSFEMNHFSITNDATNGVRFQNSYTNAADDFSFYGIGDINMYVDGTMEIKNNLTITSTITMRKATDTGNKGVDFIFI
jgi:hypothetical protein